MVEVEIPFNKPYFTGSEMKFIQDAVNRGYISGNGYYTKKCHKFFEKEYGFPKCFLTTSGSDALEMTAILLDLKPGDEVIMPSFTFTSTANAFLLRGAEIRFVDSRPDHPGMDEDLIEGMITKRTKAIVVVHYAGVACNMDQIVKIANKHNLKVIEDAALAMDSFYKGVPLGSIGHLACFSFHETKNISSGEGGMLVINDPSFEKRAEVIWEKGTDRAAFWRGEVKKYEWIDIGSSFLPSDINACLLWSQLLHLKKIQNRRKNIWNAYYDLLKENEGAYILPVIPDYASMNGCLFYMVFESMELRDHMIQALKLNNILSVFHYQSLHRSKFFRSIHPDIILQNSERYSDCLLRLPFYFELTNNDIDRIVNVILKSV